MNKLNLLIPPLAQFILIAMLIYVSSDLFPQVPLALWLRTSLLIVSILLAGLVGIAGIITFKRAQTTVNPMSPQAASTLVTNGIYKYTRNPMYLGLVILLLGEVIFLTSPIGLIFIPIFILYMNRFQITLEEQALEELFGEQFEKYQQQTRRWI